MMGIPERDIQVPDQPIRQIRRRGEAGPGNRRHAFGDGFEVLNHPRHGRKNDLDRVGGVEHLFLIFLHILGIGQG